MKYYTVAKKVDKTYGHGDFGIEYHICPIDAYFGSNKKFHPLFKTAEKAEIYKKELETSYNLIVVELEVSAI